MEKADKLKEKTLDDWRNLPGDQKADLINGEIFLHAAPHHRHSGVQACLVSALTPLRSFKRDDGSWDENEWIIKTEVGVIYGDNACTHDLAGWRKERFTSAVHDKNEITLPPDWVCEITSTNWHWDVFIKKDLLESRAIPYYWIINPLERAITVLKFDAGSKKYKPKYYSVTTDGEVVIEPFNTPISLAKVFSDVM